jgi:hypothetical protein
MPSQHFRLNATFIVLADGRLEPSHREWMLALLLVAMVGLVYGTYNV